MKYILWYKIGIENYNQPIVIKEVKKVEKDAGSIM